MSSLPHPITSTSPAARPSAVRSQSLKFTGLFLCFLLVLASIKWITENAAQGAMNVQEKRQFQLGGALAGSWKQPVFKLFSDSDEIDNPGIDAVPIPAPDPPVTQTPSISIPSGTLTTLATALAHQNGQFITQIDSSNTRILELAKTTSLSTFWTIEAQHQGSHPEAETEYQQRTTSIRTGFSSSQTLITLWDPVYTSAVTDSGSLTTFRTNQIAIVSTTSDVITLAPTLMQTQQTALQIVTDLPSGGHIEPMKGRLGQIVIVVEDLAAKSDAGSQEMDSAAGQTEQAPELRSSRVVVSLGFLGSVIDRFRHVMHSIQLKLSPVQP